MADSLRQMVGHVRLHNPDVPYFLAAQWIRDRYRKACDLRHWGFQRSETTILTEESQSDGTVTVTRGSPTVVGTGTAFDAAWIGRQFMVGGRAPVFTILAVTDTTHLTLDQSYSGTTASDVTYRIFVGYVTLPVDFRQFICVLDPQRAWQLRFWVSQEDLARRDPQRTTTQDPTLLADLKIAASGAPMFELWPYCLTERNLLVRYFAAAEELTDPDDAPKRPIRGDILVKGALADLCKWPGTPTRPNPYFGPGLGQGQAFEAEFVDMLAQVEVEDENLYLTWLHSADWHNWPYAPLDARWMQSHAVPSHY